MALEIKAFFRGFLRLGFFRRRWRLRFADAEVDNVLEGYHGQIRRTIHVGEKRRTGQLADHIDLVLAPTRHVIIAPLVHVVGRHQWAGVAVVRRRRAKH